MKRKAWHDFASLRHTRSTSYEIENDRHERATQRGAEMNKAAKLIKSEFTPITDQHGRACAVEFVPSRKRPDQIYVVFNGKRIAFRHLGKKKWISIAGYAVTNDDKGNVFIQQLH
jgi:hypothetical protein